MVGGTRVHDLLRIDARTSERLPREPSWVRAALARAPWVVVRRERLASGIAIGIRGDERSERFAAIIDASDICERLAPSDLVARIAPVGRLETAFLEASELALRCGLSLAPIGAFGFQLASGTVSTHPLSDLDLLVECDSDAIAALRTFGARCDSIAQKTGVRLDIEVAFGERAVALDEVMRGGTVIAKTSHGPSLIACPS